MANVLLVDDRPRNLLALESILEPLGHTLRRAESGEEALRRLLDEQFAVILLDVHMPGMDGFETAEAIKRRPRTRDVPIIFLTAISKEERHVFQGYDVGAVDYVFKPFDPVVLRSKVAVFVDLWEKTAQLRARELAELRRESDERYRQLADAMPQIVWTTDRGGEPTYYNERWFAYTGTSPGEADARAWTRAVHQDDLARVAEGRTAMVESGGIFEVEYRLRGADGSYRWQLGRALPMIGDAGEIEGWIGTATDIDDRKRIDDAQRFLLEAGAALASSLDHRTSLAAVARLAVAEIADWCAVHLLEDDGAIGELAVEAADPARLALPPEPCNGSPSEAVCGDRIAQVLRSGEPQLVPEVGEELLRRCGLRSFLCVPIAARGERVGAIALATAESGRILGTGDLELAEELARRAGVAIENARLYEQVEQRARAARALETIADGVVLLDREDVVLLWNPAAEQITGLRRAAVVGRPVADALPGYAGTVDGAPLDGSPQTVPLELNGRELWLSFTGVRFEEGTVYVFRDLTEERAVEQLTSDFVATVSHELRTPLAAIYGAAVTLRRRELDLDAGLARRLLDVIGEESERLTQIVTDVLLASHLDSGRLQLTIEACDGVELTRGVVAAARVHAPDGVTIALETADVVPPVAADEQQLRQVMTNLVDNAVKYSPEGGPVVVRVEPLDRSVRFSVLDEGLGVPAGERRRIFEKFYRLDPDMTRGIGGTGLGLYVCRELVRRLGGRIWVEPGSERGSTFHVEVPIVQSSAPNPPPRALAAQ